MQNKRSWSPHQLALSPEKVSLKIPRTPVLRVISAALVWTLRRRVSDWRYGAGQRGMFVAILCVLLSISWQTRQVR